MESARASLPNVELTLTNFSTPAVSGRRDSLGRTDIDSAIWSALDRAVENAAEVLGSGAGDGMETSRVAPAAIALRRLVRRNEDLVRANLPVVPREVVDLLRTEFLQQLQVEAASLDGRQVVRILLAFDTLASFSALAARRSAEPMSEQTAYSGVAPGVDGVVDIAHDMRSPLSSILFLVDAIRGGRSGAVTPVQERQLGLIYAAALGLSSLASDLIDLVRGGDRLVDGPPAPFSISEVMLNVRDMVAPVAEVKALALDFKLPKIDGRMGYPAALSRVLLNLTTNGLKYTDHGSVTIGCSEVAKSRVVFWVADTGRGIPEHIHATLFSPFRRTEGAVRFSNTGLGLAICRSLLKAMNSELRVETSQSAGTLFSFEIALPPA